MADIFIYDTGFTNIILFEFSGYLCTTNNGRVFACVGEWVRDASVTGSVPVNWF